MTPAERLAARALWGATKSALFPGFLQDLGWLAMAAVGRISEPEREDLAPLDGLYTPAFREASMSEQTTPARPFFQPRPEHDDVQTAYLLWKVAEKSIVAANGCWEWQGYRNRQGYGVFGTNHRFSVRIHRLVFGLCVKDLPDGLLVCHTCDNPPCLRPDHLFLGTEGDNIRDCVAKGRHPELKLTDAQAAEIREKAAKGERGVNRRLAREYDVSLRTINNILGGEGRYHLGPNEWRSPEWLAFIAEWQAKLPSELKAYRARHGLPQNAFAQTLGVAASYLSRVENGLRTAHPSLVVAFLRIAGIPVEGE